MRHRLLIMTLCTLGACTGVSSPRPAAQEALINRVLLPAPSGPFGAGVTRFSLDDTTRVDTLASEGGPRRLHIWLWYPSEIQSARQSPRPYLEPPTAAALAENQGIPDDLLASVVGHARHEAAPSALPDHPWPVLTFSHGLSWPASYYQTILADLASRGFVVLAVEHTHGADPVVFPNGKVVPWGLFSRFTDEIPDEALWGYVSTWRDDILFVLDAVRHSVPRGLAGEALRAADLRAVGAFGHSYGGTAAFLAAEADPSIVGAVNLEGAAYAPALPLEVTQPALYVIGELNATELSGTQFRSRGRSLIEAAVRGATHSSFSDLMILYRSSSQTMGPKGRIHPSRGTQVTARLVATFFDGLRAGRSIPDVADALRGADVDVTVP